MRPRSTFALVGLLLVASSTAAAAQACIGSVARPSSGSRKNVAATADLVSDANTFGARFGTVSNAGGRAVPAHVGVRSLSAAGTSILSVDVEFGMDFLKSENESNSFCGLVNVDLVNLTDADNGAAVVNFGFAYGKAIPAGSAAVVPFGRVGVALNSATASTNAIETSEFDTFGLIEAGLGIRMQSGLSLKGSLYQSTLEGSTSVLRLVATYPFGSR